MSRTGTAGMTQNPEGLEKEIILTFLWHSGGAEFEEVAELFRISEKTVSKLWKETQEGAVGIKTPAEQGRLFWLLLNKRVMKRQEECKQEPLRLKRLEKVGIFIGKRCFYG